MEDNNNVGFQGGQVDPNKSVMSMGDWLITFIIMMIPCVNIIMMFVWAFGNGNENRKNYCRAALIMSIIAVVLMIILMALGVFAALSAPGYY